LKAFRRDCLQIPLTVFGEDVSHRKAVTLDQVFISLNVTQKDPRHLKAEETILHPDNRELLPALEAIAPCDYAVLLGDPGSGKSSFVKHLLANQAESQFEKRLPCFPL